MDARDLLLEQTRHHYRSLDAALVGVTLEQATWPADGARPSIAWQVGHVAWNADSVAEAVAARARILGDDRGAQPHWGVTSEAHWRELVRTWEAVASATCSGLEALAADDLERPPAVEIHPAFRDHLTTRRAFWTGHVFHVAYHLGQVGSLRAGLGLGWGEPGL